MDNIFENPDSHDGAPLTDVEQSRLKALLDTVSTQTLLNSLMALERDSDDARLIIATLLDRLPAFGSGEPRGTP
jgi:hypothetical protein